MVRFEEVPWSTWAPTQRATLVFVVRGDDVLLIRKKRGLGAGKINAPGGRLDPGEAPLACAIREVQEELGVTPVEPVLRGEHSFQFVDGLGLFVSVYLARDCLGAPIETAEAIPMWCPATQIPFDEMWADDRLWIPELLRGRTFRGRWLFDGDAMLGHVLELDVHL